MLNSIDLPAAAGYWTIGLRMHAWRCRGALDIERRDSNLKAIDAAGVAVEIID
ncbi:hypothetical protein ACTZWT_04935 [Rhodopseudomonas sp. NSM]|uniref:hypothetical protein n=1 Tax=Rhodopseudomonas sp. NSM TaxID=3457630 RepID=UPI0040369CB8